MRRPGTRGLRRRGGAAVELAIMMVFLVPTFLYGLFLQDMLGYKLEMQETIVSTPWDYNYLDYNQAKLTGGGPAPATPPADDGTDPGETSGGGYDPSKSNEKPSTAPAQSGGVDNIVARQSRRTYCDHTSAYDSFDINYDCREQSVLHHTAHSAHQCWLTAAHDSSGPQARQVSCVMTNDEFSAKTQLTRKFNSDFNAGGIIKCDARLGVTNYFLPNKFFDFWTKVDVTTMKRFETGSGTTKAHSDAQGVSGKESIIFAAQAHSVLQDTWAVNRPADITPDDGSGPYRNPDSRFRARMLSYWNPNGMYLMDANLWHNAMGQDKLLSFLSQQDPVGDHLSTPPLAWKQDYQREFGKARKHYTSGWVDQRHSQSYGARQSSYFAQPNGYQ